MSSRSNSEFGSLADRVARTQAGGQAPRTPAHVDVRDDHGGWQPGLLIAWQRTATGWWGRTVWAPDGDAIEELIRADRLRPAAESREPDAGGRPTPT